MSSRFYLLILSFCIEIVNFCYIVFAESESESESEDEKERRKSTKTSVQKLIMSTSIRRGSETSEKNTDTDNGDNSSGN